MTEAPKYAVNAIYDLNGLRKHTPAAGNHLSMSQLVSVCY